MEISMENCIYLYNGKYLCFTLGNFYIDIIIVYIK